MNLYPIEIIGPRNLRNSYRYSIDGLVSSMIYLLNHWVSDDSHWVSIDRIPRGNSWTSWTHCIEIKHIIITVDTFNDHSHNYNDDHDPSKPSCWKEMANNSRLSHGHGMAEILYIPPNWMPCCRDRSYDDFATWHAMAQVDTCFEPRVIVGDVQ